jgi:hypothetical protein
LYIKTYLGAAIAMYGILRNVFTIGFELCFQADYTNWFAEADVEFNRNAQIYALPDRPYGVFRMKGFMRAKTRMLSVHVVGAHIDVTTFPNDVETGLVAIGLASEMNPQDLDKCWAEAKEKSMTPYSMI